MKHKNGNKKILIDCRMLYSSGIGVNLRSILENLHSKHNFILAGKLDEISTLSLKINFTTLSFSSPIFSISEQWFFLRYFRNVDCVWFPHWSVPLFKINNVPKIVTICDTYHLDNKNDISFINYFFAKLFLRTAVAQSTLITTISKFSKLQIIKNLDVKNLEVIKCGVPKIDRNSDKGINDRNLPRNYFLYIGNNKPHKNLIVLIKAIRLIPDVHLVIAGKMTGFRNQDKHLKVILNAEHDLNKRVHIIENFSDSEKYSLIKNSLGLVMPSVYEGFGLTPLEAQDCGVAVVISDIPVMREVYGDSAIYFDPYSHEQLCAALNVLRIDKSLVKKKCLDGKLNVRKYSWKKAAARYDKIFEEIV